MAIRNVLLAVAFAWLVALEADAGPLLFHARAPSSRSVFDVTADLTPSPAGTSPQPPEVDLADPTNLLLTEQVQNEALFSFGMQGAHGETFTFTPSWDGLSLFIATGDQGSDFKVFFDPFFTDTAGSHSPFSSAYIPGNPVLPGNPIIPGNPIFPAGSFSIQYVLNQDPPFTVGIQILDAAGDDLQLSSVPEPTSATILATGAVLIAAGARRRRARMLRG